MLLSIIILLLGFILLIWSADEFTDNGAKVAKILHLSPLLIGILIFGFGTSAPEILVSSLAALEGNIDLSLGNALGSNIINIALVLGISALISPIIVSFGILKKEWLLLIGATILLGILLLDGFLSLWDGIILVITLVAILLLIAKTSKADTSISPIELNSNDLKKPWWVWLKLGFGLCVLMVSAQMVVWSGTNLAIEFGVSQAIIGLTLVAFGTSLPELAVVILSALKKQHDMIIGNIIGSNLFNTLAVVAMPGLIHPSNFDTLLFERDYPIVLGLTLLLFMVSYKLNKQHKINRLGGCILVGVVIYYLSILF